MRGCSPGPGGWTRHDTLARAPDAAGDTSWRATAAPTRTYSGWVSVRAVRGGGGRHGRRCRASGHPAQRGTRSRDVSAPHAHAITAEIGTDPELGTGRFVLLHDPPDPRRGSRTRGSWSTWRPTSTRRWPRTSFSPMSGGPGCRSASPPLRHRTRRWGTVTAVRSTSFEALSARGHETSIQVRASWSPASLVDLPEHFSAWIGLMELCAGLDPYYPDVTRIGEISS